MTVFVHLKIQGTVSWKKILTAFRYEIFMTRISIFPVMNSLSERISNSVAHEVLVRSEICLSNANSSRQKEVNPFLFVRALVFFLSLSHFLFFFLVAFKKFAIVVELDILCRIVEVLPQTIPFPFPGPG